MSQSNFNIPDSDGVTFLAALNAALQALCSTSAGASAPTTTYAYQPWYDTTNSVLKIRDGSNANWVTFCTFGDSTKLDLYANNTKYLTIGSTGDITTYGTGAIKVPVGTSAQRPTAAQGHIRYNTDLGQFEGYYGGVWGAIGGGSNPAVDTFSGNGSTTAFTLSQAPGSANNLFVFISGVYQQKSTYTVSGTTLTFTSAPPTGTNNIQAISGIALSIGTPSDGSVTSAKLDSGGVALPNNSTATTQSAGNNSTKVATTAYVDRGASGASMVLLATATASGSSAISFTSLPSGYDYFEVVITRLSPATGSTNLLLQVSTNGGSSYINTGYSWASNYNRAGSTTPTGAGSTSAAGMAINGNTMSTAGGMCGVVRIWGVQTGGSNTPQIVADAQYWDGTNNNNDRTIGIYGTNVSANAIQFVMSSGNIASGTFALYGRRNS